MNNAENLTRKIQLEELKILKVFQEICRRHDLRYFAIGGTCIGAIRHKGFIPWDDDIDIAMPYCDYTKFLELARTELPSHYGISDSIHNRFPENACKVFNSNTTFIEHVYIKRVSLYSGVFIDVFPVHGLPPEGSERKRVRRLSSICLRLNNKFRFSFNDMWTRKAKLLWLASAPLKLFLPYNYFSIMQQNMLSRYSFNCSDKIIFPWRSAKVSAEGWYRNIFNYEDFRDSQEIPFEDTTISVPVGYESYLRMDFGDYMKLPPEDKRISSHSQCAIIDLYKPYSYYAQHQELIAKC